MARKAETGIEYFPMNADVIHNPKIKLLVAEFGSKTTWAVLLPLYCKIYREKGYWIDWLDDDSKLLFAQDECKLELSVVNEFVNGCIRRSLFNKGVFESFGILTSDRIQENYLAAKKRSPGVKVINDFIALPIHVYEKHENVALIPLDVTLITKKITVKPQSKKEILEGERELDSGKPKHTQEQIDAFKKFEIYIKDKCSNVSRMKEPFTIDQFLLLKTEFSTNQVADMLLKMHNYKPLLSKNNSANLTFRNWIKKDYGAAENKPVSTGPSLSELKANKLLTEIENGSR